MPTVFQGRKINIDEFLSAEMDGSAILPETVTACGVYVESDFRTVAGMLRCSQRFARERGPCLVYPLFGPDGKPTGDIFQLKPSNPFTSKRKYEAPKGRGNRLYLPPLPNVLETIRTPGQFIVVTEGVKKTLAACQDGVPTIGLAGVENWSGPRDKDDQGHGIGDRELMDDLLKIDWPGRPAAIVFDTDPRLNPNVNRAACQLAEALEQHGAKVSIFRFPVEYDSDRQEFRKFGIDDWILSKGAGSFREFIDQAMLPPVCHDLDRHRSEMRRQRETNRNRPGVYLDRNQAGAGKSHADILEIPHYRRSLTVTPSHDGGWEVLEKYRKNNIDAAIMPELSICKKDCIGEQCRRFKYGSNACVKDCCENFDDVAKALKWGLSPATTVCLKCEFKKDCIYHKRLKQALGAKHLICTNSRFSNSLGAVAKKAKFVTIHENAVSTLRPTIEIKGKPQTITTLEAIDQAAQQIPGLTVYANMDKWHFAWRLREAAQTFIEVFQSEPNEILGGPLELLGDASLIPGTQFDLFSLLDEMEIPSDGGDVMQLCVHAATGNLASCGIKVIPAVSQNENGERVETRFVSIVGVVRVEIPPQATVLINDGSVNAETLRSAAGLDIVDITPTGSIENQGRIVQIPVDITQQTKPDKVLGTLRSLMLQYHDKGKIGIITHQKHLKYIEKHLTGQEKARITKTDYFRGVSSRGSNDWMQCDLLIVAGTPRVPPEVVETALIQAGHPEAIPRVTGSEKENWGPDYWLARREDGRAVMVRCLSYRDHHWQQTNRSIVAEELRQCVGRARAVCADGVSDTVVISTENLGFPLSAANPHFLAEGFLRNTASVMSLFFNALTIVGHRKKGGNYAQRLLNNIIKENLRIIFPILTAKNIASSLKIKGRTAQLRLQNLSEIGFIEKVGEKSGWRLTSDHVRRFLSIGGGAALESLLKPSTSAKEK